MAHGRKFTRGTAEKITADGFTAKVTGFVNNWGEEKELGSIRLFKNAYFHQVDQGNGLVEVSFSGGFSGSYIITVKRENLDLG